ncbi:E3 ubiquitin-protein ligase MIB2-like [Neocloeon triangulifer]|uniref:E3 ubiquitin-protein ligase MIB2-like n=1 Tax=Neocloeon triangulifer TaxID=2078957 RepID=UPI00286F4C50|nr:E3 ubiquitin-protein ligase MIB2-like [Neocloeon triangulifer]
MLAIGTRVIRGPDWRWNDQDNGLGHVGTVVEVGRAGPNAGSTLEGTVVVLWDHGYRSNYRAGYQNAFDLRVYDTAPAGVKHIDLLCNECRKPIFGVRWQCRQCHDYDLCSPCYMTNKHELDHMFLRYELDNSQGIEVAPRINSRSVELKGIFIGAKVSRGHDWNWGNQDFGQIGEVVDIQNWHKETCRSVASIKWLSGTVNVYRVGHKGQVDLKTEVAGSGGLCYIDHLPILGFNAENDKPQRNFNSPKHRPVLNVGDKVKVLVSVEELQRMQIGHGGWNSRMTEFIGKVGVVHRVTDRGDIRVQYNNSSNQRWTFHPGVLTKVRAFLVDELVRVSDNLETVKANQEGHGDWVDAMRGILGKLGQVQEVYSDGDIRVAVKGQPVWTLNPLSVEPISVTPEKRNKLSEDIKNLTAMFGELELASATGRRELIKSFVVTHPNNVDMKSSGKTLLQIAAHEGKLEIASILLDANASLDEVDDEGDSALHYAAFGQKAEMLKYLVSRGASVDFPSKKQQTTALHVSVIKNNIECVKILLSFNANVNAQDCFGDTPVHDAVGKGYDDILDLLLQSPNLDLMLRNKRGFNALQHAALKGNEYAVKRLIEVGPLMVNVKKDDGFTPLHLAALNGHFAVVVALLTEGNADVNVCNNRKQTPLHLTINQGEAGEVEQLLEMGANPNLQDDNGDTPLHIALIKSCSKPDHQVNESNCKFLEEFKNTNVDEFGDQYGCAGLAVVSYLIFMDTDLNISNNRKETAMNLANQLAKLFPKILYLIKLHSAKTTKPYKSSEDTVSEGSEKSQEIITPSTSKPVPPMNLLECSVCSEQDQNVRFEPCGDVVVCEDCAGRMKKCLFCHIPISCLVTKAGIVTNKNEVQSSTDKLRVLESKIAEIEEANCCSICMERPRNVVFLCGHSACDTCAQPLKVCHMCRKTITNKINIF